MLGFHSDNMNGREINETFEISQDTHQSFSEELRHDHSVVHDHIALDRSHDCLANGQRPSSSLSMTSSHLDEEEAERRHWRKVVKTMSLYSELFSLEIQRRQSHLNKLSSSLASRLPAITYDKFALISSAVTNNQGFLQAVAQFSRNHDETLSDELVDDRIRVSDQSRNEAILHSAYREWSKEGSDERKQCFVPILNALKEFLPISHVNQLFQQHVLVPGNSALLLWYGLFLSMHAISRVRIV